MIVEASAPSNIALIKYMGKASTTGNMPSNPSLSYTLDHLRSFVTLQPNNTVDRWQWLQGFEPLELSELGQQKFLTHFKNLKQHWNVTGTYTVSSANNFSADCGLASSASSFAALTLATWHLAHPGDQGAPCLELSRLSRQGSGSSTRSFFSPWAVWRAEGAEPLAIDWTLEHAVVMVEGAKKKVSSSDAHRRVPSSLLFEGRGERAQKRLSALIVALQARQWEACYRLVWSEFQDMHALFATSEPSFGYMTGESLRVLQTLREIWERTGDGPLVTMDAGANVHLFLRPDQCTQADRWLDGLPSLKSWAR
jgi:diphosphomevalonate decarboxylase